MSMRLYDDSNRRTYNTLYSTRLKEDYIALLREVRSYNKIYRSFIRMLDKGYCVCYLYDNEFSTIKFRFNTEYKPIYILIQSYVTYCHYDSNEFVTRSYHCYYSDKKKLHYNVRKLMIKLGW